MKKSTYASLMIGIFFGCICYAVCSFFVDAVFSALLGLFTGVLYFLIFSAWGIFYAKKQARILSEYGNNFLFSKMVNYYGDNGLLNGLLVLTKETLFFIATEKKRLKIDYPLHQIADLEYIKIFRHITGINILMQNGTSGRFSMTQKEYELLKEKINTVRYISN